MKDEMRLATDIEFGQSCEPVTNSGHLDRALDRIYEKYGTDLPAFFRDAYNEATRKSSESADNNAKIASS